jgi:hypothetical protein
MWRMKKTRTPLARAAASTFATRATIALGVLELVQDADLHVVDDKRHPQGGADLVEGFWDFETGNALHQGTSGTLFSVGELRRKCLKH